MLRYSITALAKEGKAMTAHERDMAQLATLMSRYPNEKIPHSRQEYFQGAVTHRRRLFSRHYDQSRFIKLITWNVASLRSISAKHPSQLDHLIKYEKPDILCLQETKLSSSIDSTSIATFEGYSFHDAVCKERKGYSGTRTYVKKKFCSSPSHTEGFSHKTSQACKQGRVITTKINYSPAFNRLVPPALQGLLIVNTYVPTSGLDKETGTFPKLPLRLQWDHELRQHFQHIQSTDRQVPLIWTGDFNVLFDLDHHWKDNYCRMMRTPGFSFEERKSFLQTLHDSQLVDCFRHLYPKSAHSYSFWSNMEKGRLGNRGLRLDGFAISKALASRIVETHTLHWIKGSDHCPVSLWLSVA